MPFSPNSAFQKKLSSEVSERARLRTQPKPERRFCEFISERALNRGSVVHIELEKLVRLWRFRLWRILCRLRPLLERL